MWECNLNLRKMCINRLQKVPKMPLDSSQKSKTFFSSLPGHSELVRTSWPAGPVELCPVWSFLKISTGRAHQLDRTNFSRFSAQLEGGVTLSSEVQMRRMTYRWKATEDSFPMPQESLSNSKYWRRYDQNSRPHSWTTWNFSPQTCRRHFSLIRNPNEAYDHIILKLRTRAFQWYENKYQTPIMWRDVPWRVVIGLWHNSLAAYRYFGSLPPRLGFALTLRWASTGVSRNS